MSQNHELISKTFTRQRLKKQWVEAKNRGGHYTQKANNATIELAFMSVLKKAKQIFAQKSHTFVERDQRYDNTQNAFVMHSYIGNGFFFELSCNICCRYQVEYAFGNCRFEDEVRHLLKVYPLNEIAKQVSLSPDFSTFYSNVLRAQPIEFIHHI